MTVDFLTRETCKTCETNLIPRATACWLLHEVAPRSYAGSRDLSFFIPRPPQPPDSLTQRRRQYVPGQPRVPAEPPPGRRE